MMLNGWATKTVKLPKTPNKIYRLAGSWVKQPAHTKGGGYATTYLTIKEESKLRVKKETLKKPGKEKTPATLNKLSEEHKKEPRTFTASDANSSTTNLHPRSVHCILSMQKIRRVFRDFGRKNNK